MNSFRILFLLPIVFFILGCSGEKNEPETKREIKLKKTETKSKIEKKQPGTFSYLNADLKSKGTGPIFNMDLPRRIDKNMVIKGQEVFKKKCAACHFESKRFIGPEMKGLLKRRSPEWIMNTMLDPEGMLKNDPLTQKIFIEFNNIIMPNQDPTEDEARAMLEYFRTLK